MFANPMKRQIFQTFLPELRQFSVRSTAKSQSTYNSYRLPSRAIKPVDAAEQKTALQTAINIIEPKNDWTFQQIEEIYNTPLAELTFQAQTFHRRFHDPTQVQICNLLSIKTGGCTEDCKYCSQSSRYETETKASPMISKDEILAKAIEAKKNGATRFCMGAAWREMKGRKSALKRIAEIVKEVNALNMETCVTLGMLDADQIKVLEEAGLTAYNHNIDTSREHYPNVISTRSFDDRLQTINNVQRSGIKVCTGGILGLGETEKDHVSFLHTLATLPQHPESLPINRLVPIKGTPLGDELLSAKSKSKQIKFESILRTIATARLVMPESIIRLAAGRYTMKEHEQFLCFMSGCNAIFSGEKMLTTMCNGWEEDKAMLAKWGLRPMHSFEKQERQSLFV